MEYYGTTRHSSLGRRLSIWDLAVLVIVVGLIAAIFWGATGMVAPYHIGDPLPISLDIRALPGYAASSVFRMLIALVLSFIVTFTLGTLAAKNKSAERIIIPFIDIMQSIPILGFQSVSIMSFIYLFPGSLLGPQCAAIFAIFTSQAWNMILSFYQSVRTVPKELRETAAIFHLNPWQKFWRIEVPFALPSLLWNTMMSLSAGWFFVVASEAISVSNQNITLPGIGSYIHLALLESDYHAIVYAILAMFGIILLYDQLIFRPLLAWSEKFKADTNPDDEGDDPWFLDWLQRAKSVGWIKKGIRPITYAVVNIRIPFKALQLPKRLQKALLYTSTFSWQLLTFALTIGTSLFLIYFIHKNISWHEVIKVFGLGLITGFKVMVLVILASFVWVPIGVWIGLHSRLARIMQPIVQFCAAFPADVIYPIIMMVIIHYHLNTDVLSSPLMILGTQWYILFNVIAGTQSIPRDLRLAAQNYGLKGLLWWKRLILPAIFPYYITGAITAAGGSWNASILAEVISWGDTTLYATGLGAYIDQVTKAGDFPRIALGIGVMCILVIAINHLVWQRLYRLADSRYRMEEPSHE